MQNENIYKQQNHNDDQSIDIKSLIYIFLSHWYLFAIGAVLALAAAYLINRYSTNIYQAKGTVIIKEGRGLDPTTIMTTSNFANYQNLDNEIAILRSYSLKSASSKRWVSK